MKAVIDRFEGNIAVVLLGDEEIPINIPRALLPNKAGEGSWLKVNFEPDPEGEKTQREKIQGLLDKLKKKAL